MTTTTTNIGVSLSICFFQVSKRNVANVDALTTGGATGGGGKGGATGAVGGSSTSKWCLPGFFGFYLEDHPI